MKEKIGEFFKQIPHIVSIDLFGSYAEGTATEQSDIDLAILFEGGQAPNPLTLIEWREDLSTVLGKETDLVCLNDSSPILGMQVYQHRKALLVNDSSKRDQYYMRLLKEYVELKERRAPMEQNLLKRKFYDQ